MSLGALVRTRGIVSQYGWDNFKIDEKGASDLERRTLPDDLRSQIQTAINALKKQYARAEPVLKEIAALSCSVVQHEAAPIM